MLIPPAAAQALRAAETFVKIETLATYRMSAPGRRLYLALADKKHMARTWWSYSLEELRAVLGITGRYPRWAVLRRDVLLPALTSVNQHGAAQVSMQPLKTGRKVVGVRFDWRWKTVDEAQVTAEETAKAVPYAAQPAVPTAPPMIPDGSAPAECRMTL